MKKVDPQNSKYFNFYVKMAITASEQSVAVRRKVGAVIVLKSGLIATGWNGQPSGFDNGCEWLCEDGKGYDTGKTKPEVIHAERNALDKLTRQGVPTEGAILFTTTAPCMECAKSIHGVGITHVYYVDKYKCDSGIEFLNEAGVGVTWIKQ